MDSYSKIISSNSHVVEPPNRWEDGINPKFGSRVPQMRKTRSWAATPPEYTSF